MNMKQFSELFLKLVTIIGFAVLFFVPQAGAQEKVGSSAGKDNAAVLSSLLTDTVNVLYGTKPLKYVTGAISTVSGEEMQNVSGSNRLNVLSGRLAGLTITQSEGLPGFESPTLDVRGQHTFGSNGDPVVLIDGRLGDYSMLDPYDIESVTVLKDAAATIMYGLRSTNGVILITTKKGKAGKIKVSFNSETSFSQPTRLPKFLGSADYATLYDEAQLNDNPNASVKYSQTDIDKFKDGTDPYGHPNVNWVKTFLKDYTVQTRNSVSVSGGTNKSKYYFSASYLNDNGMFNTDKSANTYSTNTSMSVVSTHGNVELAISKNLTFAADMRLLRDVRNMPGAYSANYDDGIFQYLYGTPSAVMPIKNPDGSIAGTSTSFYQNNPYGLLNDRGYSIWEHTSLAFAPELIYDLGDVVKGLKFKAKFGYSNYNEYQTSRNKTFASYLLKVNTDGTTSYSKFGTDTQTNSSSGAQTAIYRNYDQSASLTYETSAGKHNINALLIYQREQLENAMVTSLAQNYQGPKGNISYGYDNRYLVDFTFAYQGSEQFPKDKRYGFFPAVSAGWVLSNEKLFKENAGESLISFLKLRGSYGLTGNMPGTYFGYLGSFSTGSSYTFGTSPSAITAYTQNRLINAVAWETCKKLNAGIDFAMFKNKLTGTFDYFNEHNEDITVSGAVTSMYGASVTTPVGKFDNKGFDFSLAWNDKINNFEYFIKGNFGIAQNKIIYQNEVSRAYPWMYTTGHPLSSRYGYVFDRFFTEDDFDANGVLKTDPSLGLANQSLLGSQKPGDLKYKDLNVDGVIDQNDQTVIGNGKIPEINYGVSVGFKTKGFDFNALFQGTGHSTTYNSGYTYWEFYNTGLGNIMEQHLNRWVPGSGQNAGYPRLTLSNTNNFVSNSYWYQDNSFIRFKYAELGYTLPERMSKKIGMSKLRIFVNGNNLYVWSKVKQKDPEVQDNGLAYPIPRTYSAGLNINF